MLAQVVMVFLSGAASLMYQVAWVRRVIGVTSATPTAQALTLAVFMAGLGLGSVLGGRLTHRRVPLRVYAAVEGGALLLAAGSVPMMDVMARWSLLLGDDARGLGTAVLWSAICAFLGLAATLLGASLPLVMEHVERRATAGNLPAWRTSVLYGTNTLGATLGCLLAGFVTVEHLGLRNTTWVGAGLALACVLLALATPLPPPVPEAPPPPVLVNPRLPARILVLAALGGFAGLASEVVWTRLVSLVVLTTVYAYSQVLAAVLLGVALGALLANAIIKRATRAEQVAYPAALLLSLAGLCTAGVPALILRVAEQNALLMDLARGASWTAAGVLAALLIPPAALVGSLLPLLTAMVRERGPVAFAGLYAANTAGSVVGSLMAGFVMLPFVGMQFSTVVLVAVCLGTAALLVPAGEWGRARWVVGPAAAVSVFLLVSVDLPRQVLATRLDPDTRILAIHEGLQSDVMVTQQERGPRRLWINSAWVAGTGGGHVALGHLPALLVAAPRRALGIALGTGQTFSAVYKHGAPEMHCVEIDPGVVLLSRPWFKDVTGGLFDRPNVTLHLDDGRAYLRRTALDFDVVVLEPLQAWSAGTANLYSREFYQEARRVMNPEGTLAQWIPFYGQGVAETRAMVATALEVFPYATLWLDEHDGILVLQQQPPQLAAETLWPRVQARGIAPELVTVGLDTPEDLRSLFMAGTEGLRAWTRGADVLTDDRPRLEFVAARQMGREGYEEILASLVPHLEDVDAGGTGAARAIREVVLAAALKEQEEPEVRAAIFEKGMEALPQSRLLRVHYGATVLETAERWEARDPKQAEAWYLRGLAHDPGQGDIAVRLAVLRFRRGDAAGAREAAQQARALPSHAAVAEKLLKAMEEAVARARPGAPPAE